MMTKTIKEEFGKRLRYARDAKRLSRAALGVRLGVSPKTIQSWEMGRTFIEDLSLIPAIESELGVAVSALIAKSVDPSTTPLLAAEPGEQYGRKRTPPRAGPIPLQFELHAVKTAAQLDEEKLAKQFVAIPMVKPNTLIKPVAELGPRDVQRYVVIPGEWVPRGGVLVATRMGDSAMAPMIPLGATVVIDRRPCPVEKGMNRVVALNLASKGVRIRRLITDPMSQKIVGVPTIEGRRGKIDYREDLGDTILGRLVGIQAQPE